jgi:hypothetical protein
MPPLKLIQTSLRILGKTWDVSLKMFLILYSLLCVLTCIVGNFKLYLFYNLDVDFGEHIKFLPTVVNNSAGSLMSRNA